VILLVLVAAAAPVRWCADVDAGSYPSDAFVYDVIEAWRAWEAAVPCADIADEYLGDCDTAWSGSDVWFRIDDAGIDDGVHEGVVLYTYTDAVEVRLSSTVDWLSQAEGAAPACVDGVTAYAVVAHQIGHVLGLTETADPACGPGVMDPASAVCAPPPFTACDAQEALRVLGPVWVDPTPRGEVTGATPFGTCLSVPVRTASGLAPVVTWDLGDGGTATGDTVCHTWAEQQEATVSIAWVYPASCGGWTGGVDPWAVVRVCDPPQAEAGAAGLFDLVAGRASISVENHADLGTWGCVTTTAWTLSRPDGTVVDESSVWAPTFSGLAAGRYRVVGTLEGPGGSSVAEATVVVGGLGCGGCGGSGPVLGIGAIVASAALFGVRRRP
jgi:hypothetical protein